MKAKEIPDAAWAAPGTEIPTKLAPDWDALYETLAAQGWIVLEPPPEDRRETANGSCESKMFKDFRNYAMYNRKVMLNARRIGLNRWYVVIGNPYRRTK